MAEITIERYECGQPQTEASQALMAWLNATETDRSYLPMMQYRVAGKAAGACKDVYYIAMKDGKAVSRLWNGWGNHPNAVGNYGNFLTLEDVRGEGVGRQMLKTWHEDLMQTENRPLGLFCSAMNTFLIDMYGKYGFRQAVIMPAYSFLYKPLDGSPEDFNALCEDYYCSAQSLTVRPANVEYRHEIDCLLKFSMTARGETFGLPGCKVIEEAFVWPHKGTAEILFTEKNRPVGWSYTPAGGEKAWQIHPDFRKQFAESGIA